MYLLLLSLLPWKLFRSCCISEDQYALLILVFNLLVVVIVGDVCELDVIGLKEEILLLELLVVVMI